MTAPDHDAWISRFKALRKFVEENKRLPRPDVAGGPEDTLCTWLGRQRQAHLQGQLPPNLQTILRMVPSALPRPKRPPRKNRKSRAKGAVPAAVRDPAARIEDFYAEHERLPRHGGPVPGERFLYRYLLETVRAGFREGTLDPSLVGRMEKIPNALTARNYSRGQASEAKAA